MKRLIALFVAVIMMIGILAGCGQQAQENTKETSTTTAAQETQGTQDTEASSFPLAVKDANGVEMTIEKKPERIASLTLGTDEMLLYLVDKSRIIALSTLADMVGTSNIVDMAKEFPNKISSQNIESIISLKPDLVFAASWADANFLKQLRDAGIVVYCYMTPNNIEQQKATIKEIAHLTGEDKKGEELVAWMDGKLKEIEDRVKNLKEEERLTVMYYDSSGYTNGTNTTFDDIVARAGLVNAAAKAGIDGWPQISKEKLVELNPDIIIVPSVSWTEKTPEAFAEELKKDASLKDVSAIKNDRVFILPDAHRSAISQYVVYGVEDVAKAAYPELFK